ncbi:helix-turn-helix domain-containing protein [Ulvibacter antarcticus]|uniref:AraC-like DNA-binding protein n=1 Tax=Ulvibacter antarcticus TaxID=442714 RepID=A0A3L9YWH5_9FLAO|nr:helix-turn-helix domain-containing protein [Ulvibacter antarcticus]RMA64674.1 AraC-like DNA-binding protein [Ulvibacter antarcticus]
MEVLRYFIFIYCFLGVFIAGGLFFKRRSPANITLAIFIFLFTLEQLDFLYTTSDIVLIYPEYYLLIYPVCLLFGPSLWMHFRYVQHPELKFKYTHLLHALPFLVFVVFLLAPIIKLEGAQRLEYTRINFNSHMMPLNYIRTTHVTFYGLLMLFVIIKNKVFRNNQQGVYLTVVAVIYFLTAVLQSYLTRFADSYRQFVLYFFLASTIVLIAGFVLYTYPEILIQLQKKYFSSSLKTTDRNRIVEKINNVTKDPFVFLNSSLSLNQFCDKIQEKTHHVSQVFSENFSTSFSNYLNLQRVEHAKALLRDRQQDHLKILAVAFESGFNNNVTFNKAFVKCTGITPGKYRKQSKKG